MEHTQKKIDFLKNDYVPALEALDAGTQGLWGKMNVQQMIEHMSEYISIASGRLPMQIVTPEEHLPRMQAFLATEKQFRENTPNALMADTPPPVKHATITDAVTELKGEIDHFFEAYGSEPGKVLANPFFGMLGFEQQVQLLHKHATHHLRQFGVMV
jgi:hypothetical protein